MKFGLFLGLLLTCPFVVRAQKFEIENKFHIKQDNKSIVFHVLDVDDSQLKKYDPEKIYYWFKAQKVLNTQGGSSGSLLDGEFESFYKNNQLSEKGLFRKGLKHGVWKFWDQSGTLIHQENWNKGTQTGKQLYYSGNGVIQKTIICKSRQTQIIAQDTTIVKSKKKTVTTVRDSLGNIVSQTRFVNGLADGTHISRSADGTITKTTYKKGELIPEKVKSEKSGKTKEEKTAGEKRTFKEKMKNFWEKLKFWKKFKKKEKNADNTGKEKQANQPKAEKTKKADKKKEPAATEPKEKKKRKEQ